MTSMARRMVTVGGLAAGVVALDAQAPAVAAIGPARLPGGRGGGRAGAAVGDRLAAQRRRAGHRAAGTAAHRARRQAAAAGRRGRAPGGLRRAGRPARGRRAPELRHQPLPLHHLFQDQGRRQRHDHRAGPRHLRERSPDQRAAALRVGLDRPRPLRRQDRLRREGLPVPHPGRSAGAARGRPREASGAGPHQPSRQADPPARRRQGARRQPVREAAPAPSPRSGATGIATSRASPSIPRPATSGPTNTARRAGTSSTSSVPGATTAGR